MKNKLISILLFGLLMTVSITVNAQLSMVKDLQAALNTAGSEPSSFIEMNGYLYFAANGPLVGTELWRTDGTPAGTELVKDIVPGTESSNPSNLFVYNGNLYFSANGVGGYSNGLWKSDGTENGTKLVNIYNKDYVINPREFIIFQGSLFFQAADTNGTELFKSNGLDSGTVIVKDIFPDTAKKYVQNSSNPHNFMVVNGVLYFQAASKGKGTELWKSDGTTAGTVLVKDINADTLNSDPNQLINLNGTLYFVANNGSSGDELWKSNGTAAGTVMVTDINSTGGSSITFMTKYNNNLYFSANNGTDGAELWISDGTGPGTQLLININPGSNSSYPSLFTEFNGNLYFTASNGSKGFELWVSDGTAGGTMQLKDIYNGTMGSEPTLYTVANNMLFFVAQNTGVGNELWRSDGTPVGTIMLKDILSGPNPSNPRYLTAFKNMLIFSAEDGSYGRELWKSDGSTTPTGTVLLKDILSGTKPANPSQLVNMKGMLYFTAESTANGNELFKSNGTDAGTVVVRDIIPGISSSMPKNLTNVNDVLFFSADNSTNGNELWKSNGTQAGTVIVKDINTGFYASDPNNFCNVNDTLYFSADDGVNGFELWKSNGTAAGTVMVKDIYPDLGPIGANSSNPKGLFNVNGTIFFAATDSTHGRELWKSDGTEAGTVLVSDITLGAKSSVINNFFNYNGLLLFQGYDSINGTELWKSDGTATGTVMVKDIFPDTNKYGFYNQSYPGLFIELKGKVYFQATDSNGTELWRTDGTDTGTKIFKDIYPGSSYGYAISSMPRYLTKIGNEIFFSASSPTKGNELWKTDGTVTGTVLFKDIIPGYNSSYPVNLLADGPNLYFVANDGIHGSELWKAEFNQCGATQMTGETNPGKIGTGPTNLCMAGGVLYFTASTSAYGSELWKYNSVIIYSDTANLSYSICTGDSVLMHNHYYKTTGVFRDSLSTAKGCDSLILMKLTVNAPYFKTTTIAKCIGDSVLIQGVYRKVAGTYTDSLKTIHGCDSILDITLTLSPKPPTPVITIVPTITLRSSAATGNQWYDDNGPVAGATGQTYATTSGTKKFYVIVTIDGCSSDPSNSANPQLGSINNDNFRNLNIYPNPVSDKMILEFKEKQNGRYTYYINNLEGRAVITGTLTETKNEIDVSNIPKGIYFIKIISEDQIGLFKIIKD